MAPFIPFVERGTSSMSIFAFQLIRFVCRGTSFSFWVAIRLSEHARAIRLPSRSAGLQVLD
jgi:hypothetical protein